MEFNIEEISLESEEIILDNEEFVLAIEEISLESKDISLESEEFTFVNPSESEIYDTHCIFLTEPELEDQIFKIKLYCASKNYSSSVLSKMYIGANVSNFKKHIVYYGINEKDAWILSSLKSIRDHLIIAYFTNNTAKYDLLRNLFEYVEENYDHPEFQKFLGPPAMAEFVLLKVNANTKRVTGIFSGIKKYLTIKA